MGCDAAQLAGDRLMHAVEIFQDLVVPKPQNAKAFALQERFSLGFPRRQGIVLAAVDFHDQPGLVVHEVGNVMANRGLAAELAALHSI
jgi:hypothetical protein